MALKDEMKRLPAIGVLLEHPDLKETAPRWAVVSAARSVVHEARQAIVDGGAAPAVEEIVARVAARAAALARPTLRPVINATGVVVHTNLGRAPLSAAAVEALVAVASGYSNLEYDTGSGGRGSRGVHGVGRLKALTGAPGAMVVNNNAAAVFLCLSALSAGREVIVSRGELVEIGGSFRIPDILAAGGAKLVEVGTTNRTRISDYAAAITDETSMLVKVHPSNFRMEGFTQSVSREELVALGQARGLVVMEDLGSGSLLPSSRRPPGWEAPHVAEVIAAGVGLCTFSGDKLLGGPQAGIICGDAALIETLKKHPLARALRVDKLTLAALDATLAAYQDGRELEVPVVAALCRDTEELARAAQALLSAMSARVAGFEAAFDAQLGRGGSRAGGGAMPEVPLETTLVVLKPRFEAAATLARALRRHDRGVVCRVSDGSLVFDPRTLFPGDTAIICAALSQALASR